jgi:maltokinase
VDGLRFTLPLPDGLRLELVADGSGWHPVLQPPGQLDASGLYRGAARWFVEQLSRLELPLYNNGFRLLRLARPAPPGPGERVISADQTNRSVVVGEQVVVKWLRRLDDAEHPALSALAHLAEVGFTGVPTSFGALTWRAPSGHDLPVGFATRFLPGSRDGWDWCVEALELDLRSSLPAELESSPAPPGSFPAALGRLAAGLHAAFATPSTVVPQPIGAARRDQIRSWQAGARSLLAELMAQIDEVDGAEAGPEGDRPLHTPSAVIAGNRARMESIIDRLLDHQGPTPIQRIHGDLHVGQVLNSAGDLAVIDFDGNPVLGSASAFQPAARDVAQLLLSLDQVGRIADRRSGFSITADIDVWSRTARAELLTAYQAELGALGRADVFDVRLLPSFLVEQACRDLVYAVRFLPRWAYATIDGLETILGDLTSAESSH